MNPEAQVARLKSGLRSFLKRSGKTYADVAELLQVSVPTVKRILTKEELSLSRLLKLCEWLELDLSALEEWAKSSDPDPRYFTIDQELFLASDPRYLAFFYELYDKPVADIAAEYRLNKRSVDHYLLRLEQAELIHVTGKGVARPRFREPLLWNQRGPLISQHYEVLVDTIFSMFRRRGLMKLREEDTQDDARVIMWLEKTDGLSEKSFDQLLVETRELFDRYSKIGKTESQLKTSACSFVHLCGLARLPKDDPDAASLDQVFGRITNVDR